MPMHGSAARRLAPYEVPRSRTRYRGAWSHGNASVTWCEIHSAVGFAVLPSPAHLRPVGRLGAITPAPSFFFLRAAHITKLLVQILERLDILSASEPATVGPVGGFFVGGNSRFTGGEDRDRGAIANYGYNARADHGGGWGRNRPNCGYNGRGGPGGGTSRNRPKPE
jgi:hypothetical protein